MTTALRVPFDISPTGRVGFASGDYDVANQYIKMVLLTRIGERLMRPAYGSRVRDSVFDPIGPELTQMLEGDIRDAVRAWEPGVRVHAVEFEDSGSTLEIDIQYSIGSTLGLPPSTVRVSIDVGGTVEESR